MSKEWVEQSPATGLAIRIFRNKKQAAIHCANPNRGLDPEPIIRQMERSVAVDQIRRQVYDKYEHKCAKCTKLLRFERGHLNSMELDEVQARGECEQVSKYDYQSGEVSVANGQPLCRDCHTGKGGKHDRSPSFTTTETKAHAAL